MGSSFFCWILEKRGRKYGKSGILGLVWLGTRPKNQKQEGPEKRTRR